ncbi:MULTISPECIES: serine/threonine-protein kinase [unclassified Corallococcus]|uniref:serine/threonine-protein kinase n=1 Tax=unclassified Corallococcus TaxID=2685029 RepID=UPI001A8D28F1|nr:MULTISPECIES: serine/threonine-protein kinase [unclassified Corallococcus]MBN9687604.1 protein kinase [Corallococcus sp. NCSPR001]WAS88578.1 protein kinase [Corallococcus sp. NCRR]
MALDAGDTFGRYELVSWLGRGGMAETWHAQLVGAAGVTKPVLIKKVLPEYADDEAFISMFISEARISATLSHGNVAQVFDFGQVEGEYFLAMEFVDGKPLDKVLKRAMKSGLPALPIPVAVFIAMEMCRGLHYAHSRTDSSGKPLGIVHRDISPDNVLVSYEGQVKIVDFGIAKAQLQRGFKTAPGVVKGKYLFFSPEQARGEDVDARTDVWATGVVLYELLCGRLPVDGPPHVVMMKIAHGEIPPLSQLRPDLPEALNHIVLQALNPDPARRFATSHAFGDALAGFLYANHPRFSSLSLAHLLRVLFRGDLLNEGRELAVPDDFLAELKAWRNPVTRDQLPTVPHLRAIQTPRPSPAPVVVTRESQEEEAPDVPTAEIAPVRRSRRPWVWLAVGSAALLALGGGVWWTRFRHAPEAPRAESALVPPLATTVSEPAPAPEEPVEVDAGVTPEPPPSPPAALAWSETRVRSLLDDVYRLNKSNKELARAAKLVQTCVDAVPDNADCRLAAGLTYERLRAFDKSALHYRAFLQNTPTTDLRRGAVSERLAALPLRKPLESTPANEADLESARSAVLMHLTRGQLKEALDAASQCVSRLPREPECHLLQGDVLAKMNQVPESTRSYERFLTFAPADHPRRPSVLRKLVELRATAP